MFYGIGLRDLVDADLLQVGATIVAERGGVTYRATIAADGAIALADGTTFKSPSGAADHLTQTSNNGWEFWRLDRGDDRRTLAQLRAAHLAAGPTAS